MKNQKTEYLPDQALAMAFQLLTDLIREEDEINEQVTADAVCEIKFSTSELNLAISFEKTSNRIAITKRPEKNNPVLLDLTWEPLERTELHLAQLELFYSLIQMLRLFHENSKGNS